MRMNDNRLVKVVAGSLEVGSKVKWVKDLQLILSVTLT